MEFCRPFRQRSASLFPAGGHLPAAIGLFAENPLTGTLPFPGAIGDSDPAAVRPALPEVPEHGDFSGNAGIRVIPSAGRTLDSTIQGSVQGFLKNWYKSSPGVWILHYLIQIHNQRNLKLKSDSSFSLWAVRSTGRELTCF